MNRLIKHRIDELQRRQFYDASPPTAATTTTTMTTTARRVSYVDWGHIMAPRSWPQNVRIAGDIDQHVGLEARLAMIQATTNHLAEQDRQQRHGIPPWSVTHPPSNNDDNTNDDNDGDDDCRVASPYRRPEYCNTLSREERDRAFDEFLDVAIPDPPLTLEEQTTYVNDQRRFCSTCVWNGKVNCDSRLTYLIHTYGGPRHTQLHNMLQGTPACVKPDDADDGTETDGAA
jgi:hypothetical protein